MIKKLLKKTILVGALLGTPLMAGWSESDTNNYSLVGFEAGYGNFEVVNDATPAYDKTHGLAQAGFKVGAQSDEYRIFLSARYYNSSDFDYISTFGIEAQYLFGINDKLNAYIGLNTGVANAKFIDSANITRTISDSYIGGDAGINFLINKTLDLELGARIMGLQATNSRSNVTYTFDNIISVYGSVIFKFNID